MKLNNKYLTMVLFLIFGSGNSYAEKCQPGPIYAFSPYTMECLEFDDSCELPDQWVPVGSCNFTTLSKKATPSIDPSQLNRPGLNKRENASGGFYNQSANQGASGNNSQGYHSENKSRNGFFFRD